MSLVEHCTSLQRQPTLHTKITVSELGFFNLVYTRSNCMWWDKGFYPKLNNIAKVSVNLKVFVSFHGVCFPFSLSLLWSFSIKRRLESVWASVWNAKKCVFTGLKSMRLSGLNPLQGAKSWALGFCKPRRPQARFFKHSLGYTQIHINKFRNIIRRDKA